MLTRKACDGFTLIELMIVVAIIGIMASLAIPSYQQYTVKTQPVDAMNMSEQLKDNIEVFYNKHHRMPRNNKEAGLPEPQHLISNYIKSVKVENGALHFQLGNKINQKLSDKILSIQPLTVDGSSASPIDWGCGYATAPDGMSKQGSNNTDIDHFYLPINCRI